MIQKKTLPDAIDAEPQLTILMMNSEKYPKPYSSQILLCSSRQSDEDRPMKCIRSSLRD